jgi:hypothetical protein
VPYNAGTAYLQVIPSFRDIEKNIVKDLRHIARAFGNELEKQIPKTLSDALSKATRDAEKDVTKSATDLANARADALRKVLDDAAEEDLRRTRENTKKQGDLYGGLATMRRKLAEKDLREYDRNRAEEVRLEEQAAKARIESARREIGERSKLLEQARREAQRAANDAFRGTTAGRAQGGTQAARDAIQNIPIHIDDASIDGEIQRIRARLSTLGDFKIGVDIDVEDFATQVQAEFERLRTIAHDLTVDIDVRTDAAAAATELGAVLVLLNRIDGQDANVDVNVDTDSARARFVAFGQSLEVNLSRLGNLIALGASLGSAIVPAAAVATAAIGALGTAALAAGSAIGVMVLGFGGVGDAVKALSAAADDEAKTNKALVQSQNQVANAIDGVTSARRSLANTIANNRDAAIRADEAVASAERALQRARREAARSVEESERRVAAARQRAAQDAADAARRVQDAERALASDERNVLRAREALTEAYRDAQKALDDVASSMKHNSLDQQQALLDIAEAKEELDKLLANPRATDAEREQARINYERRKLELQDLTTTQNQLNEEYDKYTENGLEGSEQVINAQERIRDAEEKVAADRRALADAQKAQTKALIDGQKAIADAIRAQQEAQEQSAERIQDAERRLASERRDRDAQQRQAAFALAGAQQAVVQAQRALAGAYASAGAAGGAALDKVNTAMGKLSPTAQRFARFIFGLRDDFYDLRAAASDGMLSGLQTAITSLLPYLPAIRDFVRKVSNKLGQTFIDFADALKEPVFREFFDYIKKTAVPTLDDLFTISLNLLRGLTGLFLGFTPFTEDVTGGLVDMSQAFADWGTSLGQNQGFQDFLQYIRDNGPTVVEFFGSIVKLGARFVQAMAPIGPVVIRILDAIVSFLANLPPDVLAAIVAGIAGLAAALGVLSAATSVAAISTTALIIAGVVAAVAAAVAAIVLLFQKVTPLREFFVNLWRTISTAFVNAYNDIKPSLDQLGDSALQLWHGAFLPAFRGIWDVVQQVWGYLKPIFQIIGLALAGVGKVVIWLWKNVWVPYFSLIVDYITEVVVPVIRWLYNNVVKPVFANIQTAANVLAAVAKVAFGVIQIAAKVLGAVFKTFYALFIQPFLNKMRPFFDWLTGIIRDHVQPAWEKAINALGKFWEDLRKRASAPIRFVVETLLNDGILKGYNKLADMFDVDPKNVQIPPPKAGWSTGGVMDVLPGYRPGVDNHTFVSPTGGVIGLSGGEGILRPELTALVRPWLEQGNKVARTGGKAAVGRWLGGYARGGVLGDWFNSAKKKGSEFWGGLKDKASDVYEGAKSLISDPAGFLKKIATGLINLVPGHDTSFGKAVIGLPNKALSFLTTKIQDVLSLGGAAGDGGAGIAGGSALGGSAGMMRILRAVFPGLPLISGFRPHAITATGNPSYHGKNRAVDLPPRMDVFNWLRANYPNSRELIFSPAGARQIHNGRPHVYTGITKRMHYNHVHWAYDKGGWLPDTRQMPGQMMSVFHGRRQPDAVLSNEQWSNVSRLARQATYVGGRGGDNYNFDFANSTLTADRLSSIQSQRDTLHRVTRPNW